MTTSDLPTPALLVDVPAMERNIARMAAFFADRPARLRPHLKAHKTAAIAQRQLAGGACVGLTAATVAEAELAATLCDDVLLANEVVDPARCLRLAALAARVRLTVAVDSPAGLDRLAAAAMSRGVEIGVLVDLNVGQERCGLPPGEAAVALARQAHATRGLVLRGVMGYEGQVQPIADRVERTQQANAAMRRLVGTAAQLRAAGLPCEVVSGGGTGTFDISGAVPGVTEIQAGSYVVMDTDYTRVGVPFEQALFLLGTVVSRPAPGRCVLDSGHKATTKDHGLPQVAGVAGAEVVSLNDEHATLRIPDDCPLAIGDRVRLVPSHVDPTMNLHDAVYAVDGEQVLARWPIARGYDTVEP